MTLILYSCRFSPPCQAILLTIKELNINIDLIVEDVDLTVGQNFYPEYLKMNPVHTVPTIDDNGFILWESKAILQYLCNSYAPDSPLYPNDVKQRALIERWFNFDLTLFNLVKEAIAKPMFGLPVSEESQKSLKDMVKLLDQLIGNQKYLVDKHLTIADLSMLTTTYSLVKFAPDLDDCPNLKNWLNGITKELSYFNEICDIPAEDMLTFAAKMKQFFCKLNEQDNV